jgi:hypothetical protein
LPEHKDWNADLVKAESGLEVEPAEKHPQMAIAEDVCARLDALCAGFPQSTRPEDKLPSLLRCHILTARLGPWEKVSAILEDMAALALFAAAREYRQMGRDVLPAVLADDLLGAFHPRDNWDNSRGRADEIAMKLTAALRLLGADGVRSEGQKEKQAAAFMDLARFCAQIAVCYMEDELKQEHKQEWRQELRRNPAITMG